jgi:uncharacterized membrane protein
VRLFAGALLLLAGIIDVVLGIGALAGSDRLEANIREIETNEDFGDLYISLEGWGAVALVLGLGALAGGANLLGESARGRLIGLVGAYFALAGAFFGLAIFRWLAVAVIVLLLAAIYLLSYHVAGDPDDPGDRKVTGGADDA